MAFVPSSPNQVVGAAAPLPNLSVNPSSTPNEIVQASRIYNESTKATAGTPGSFNNDPPWSLTDLTKMGPLGNTTPWTTGQRVVLGNATLASWSGTNWVGGPAP